VLDLLASRVFSREDLFETRQGQCRLLPSLTEQLTATTGTWAKAVAPWAEWTAKRMLTGGSEGSRITLPTPLTGANRRIGRGLLPTATAAALPKPAAICRGCGLALEDQRRRSCPVCLPQVKMRVSTGFLEAGPAELARLRANNADPAHGGNAGEHEGSGTPTTSLRTLRGQPSRGHSAILSCSDGRSCHYSKASRWAQWLGQLDYLLPTADLCGEG